MSKSSRKAKNVPGTPVSSHDRRMADINSIDFKRAWAEARVIDAFLPVEPPENLPEEAKRMITLLVRRVLMLESEWS